MKLLILCGYFEEQNEAEVVLHARRAVEFSANQFQRKLISGFRALCPEVQVISAPFVGSYPNASDVAVFRGFRTEPRECRYVSFNNIWGVRNLSRAAALKKAICSFAEDPDDEKIIVVYCPHTPFLEAAAYAKKKDPKIRISLYVPDLPQYMNLNADRSRLYDAAKFFDNARMRNCMKTVDSYILLTEPMKNKLPVGNKPCLVAEGIVDRIPELLPEEAPDGLKPVVYTGKLNEKFGVKDLIDGFHLIPDPDYRLVLCGTGDCMDYAREAAARDGRIVLTGQISPGEAAQWQRKAAVLVNPRPNGEEYTKYSFPSKNIEYLLTGKPVVAFLLDGMPEIYKDFLYPVKSGEKAAESLAEAISMAAKDCPEKHRSKYRAFVRYAEENLLAEGIARAILEQHR